MSSNVNSPDHYNQGGIECIDAIKASLTEEGFKGFLKGNIQKYMWRYELKNGTEDLDKAQWYLDRLKEQFGGDDTLDDMIDRTRVPERKGWFGVRNINQTMTKRALHEMIKKEFATDDYVISEAENNTTDDVVMTGARIFMYKV